jgi:ABC-type iron transport system FetAB ATPase subunit
LSEEDVPAWVTSLSRAEAVEDDQTTPESGLIRFNEATFTWPQSEESRKTELFKLGPLTLELPIGKLAIVTGPTGSGKSSFLCAILGGRLQFIYTQFALPIVSLKLVCLLLTRASLTFFGAEMDCIEGSVHVDKSGGKVAYAAQTAWLESATIRENIVFQSEFEQGRYGESGFMQTPSLADRQLINYLYC